MVALRAAGLAAGAGVLLVVVAVTLVGPEASAPGELLRTPSWLIAPPKFDLTKEDKKVQAVTSGQKEVQALHSLDPDFPVVNREGNLAGAAARTGGKAQGAYPRRFSARTSHAAVETPNDEWQADRNKMQNAVHLFHKDGDAALEKLIPARTVKRQYKSALTKGEQQIERLEDARKQGQLDEANANGALKAVEKGIAQQDALKREAEQARAEGKEYAQKMRIADLKKKLKLQAERDRRRENIVKSQVEELARENKELRKKDAKISLQMEEVPAVGAREGNLVALRHQIKELQNSESSKVDSLKEELNAMKDQMKNLQSVAKVHRQQAHHADRHQEDDLKPSKEVAAKLEERKEAVKMETVSSAKQLLKLVTEDQEKQEERERESQTDMEQDMRAQSSESSSECTPCDGGDNCEAGCLKSPTTSQLRRRLIQKDLRDGVNPLKDHQLSLLSPPQGYNAVPLGADGVMPKGEEYGSSMKHCRSGNCEPLETEGVKVDGWGVGQGDKGVKGLYRMLPLPHLDPSAKQSVMRKMNQREGRWSFYNKAGQDGVYTPGATWGANSKWIAHDSSPGAKKLEKHGVVVDGWPVNIYKGIPIANFDRTNWDHKKNEPFTPDNPNKFNRESNKNLETAGVLVNKWPSEDFSGERDSPTIDGQADRKIQYQPVPEYRRSGIARQEKPLYFLLRPHVNLAEPQPVVDHKRGLEYDDEYSQEGRKPGEYGYQGVQESLGCGPQGCF